MINAGSSKQIPSRWLISGLNDLKRPITHYGFEERQFDKVRDALNAAETSSNCLFLC